MQISWKSTAGLGGSAYTITLTHELAPLDSAHVLSGGSEHGVGGQAVAAMSARRLRQRYGAGPAIAPSESRSAGWHDQQNRATDRDTLGRSGQTQMLTAQVFTWLALTRMSNFCRYALTTVPSSLSS